MSRRHVNKVRTRTRRTLRRDLVHAAGCTYRGDCDRWAACLYRDLAPAIIAEALSIGVSIPRSLRKLATHRPEL